MDRSQIIHSFTAHSRHSTAPATKMASLKDAALPASLPVWQPPTAPARRARQDARAHSRCCQRQNAALAAARQNRKHTSHPPGPWQRCQLCGMDWWACGLAQPSGLWATVCGNKKCSPSSMLPLQPRLNLTCRDPDLADRWPAQVGGISRCGLDSLGRRRFDFLERLVLLNATCGLVLLARIARGHCTGTS